MTKFLSKVFLSGILLSSVSGYCSDTVNISKGTYDSESSTLTANGAIFSVIGNDKNINCNINVGDANDSGVVSSDDNEHAKIQLANGAKLTLDKNDGATPISNNLDQNITVYASGKIEGPSEAENSSTIDLNGTNHSIVFHPGSTTSGNVTITSQPTGNDHTGIVDLSNYITTNNSGNLSFSSGNTDEQKLSLTLNNVQVKLFNDTTTADYKTLLDNLTEIVFSNITTTTTSEGNPTVTLINFPGGVKFIDSDNQETNYSSSTVYSNGGIIRNIVLSTENILSGPFNIETTGGNVSIDNVVEDTTGNVAIDVDSFSGANIKNLITKIKSDTNTVLFTSEYTIDISETSAIDFNRIRTNVITEYNDISSSSVSNVKNYNSQVTQYTPVKDNIIRIFTSSTIDFNGNDKKTSTLTLGDSSKTDQSFATTLNLTGTHTVTTTLSINNGSTINLKPGSTLTLGALS
jgi:hypothetical protein